MIYLFQTINLYIYIYIYIYIYLGLKGDLLFLRCLSLRCLSFPRFVEPLPGESGVKAYPEDHVCWRDSLLREMISEDLKGVARHGYSQLYTMQSRSSNNLGVPYFIKR